MIAVSITAIGALIVWGSLLREKEREIMHRNSPLRPGNHVPTAQQPAPMKPKLLFAGVVLVVIAVGAML